MNLVCQHEMPSMHRIQLPTPQHLSINVNTDILYVYLTISIISPPYVSPHYTLATVHVHIAKTLTSFYTYINTPKLV